MNREQALQLIDSVRDIYNQIADHWDQSRYTTWPDSKHFIEYFDDGQEILDVGCGNGRNLELFEGMNVSYVGVDFSQNLIEHAKTKHFGPDHKSFYVSSALDLSQVPGQYDVVLIIAVLQHIPKPLHDEAVAQIVSKLKPRGRLVMTNWNMWQKKFFKIMIEQWRQNKVSQNETIFGIPFGDLGLKDMFIHYKKNQEDDRFSRYMYAFTKGELERLLKRHGLTIEKSLYTSGKQIRHIWNSKNILTVATKHGN